MDLIVVAVKFIIGYLSVSQTFMFCSWVKAVQKVVWDQHGKLPHIIYHIIASLFSQRTFSSLCNAIALCRLGKFHLLLMQKKKKRKKKKKHLCLSYRVSESTKLPFRDIFGYSYNPVLRVEMNGASTTQNVNGFIPGWMVWNPNSWSVIGHRNANSAIVF